MVKIAYSLFVDNLKSTIEISKVLAAFPCHVQDWKLVIQDGGLIFIWRVQ